MALQYFYPSRSSPPAQGAEGEEISFDLWSERVVTAVATALAVLVVATIAVLIGMV